MLLDRQNLHGKNSYLAKSNLQVQCNLQQNSTNTLITFKGQCSISYGKPKMKQTNKQNKQLKNKQKLEYLIQSRPIKEFLEVSPSLVSSYT